MRRMKAVLGYGVLAAIIVVAAAAGFAWHWVYSPVRMDANPIDYTVEPGSSPRIIARLMNKQGIHVNETGFVLLARLSGRAKGLKAGAYETQAGDTPWKLLERMANGDMTQARLTLVEGWTYQRIRQALRDDPSVKQTLQGVSDKELLSRLGSDKTNPEGLFFPDTYVFAPGTSDFDILRRAYRAEQSLLATLWADREPGLPLTSPYQALILASLIEKETGHSADRRRVAGVFVNRLRLNMPLQTDPSVIYGMGDAYHGKLHKKDLETDTPWNTYTRTGLPPTPIACVGKASLLAALHPEAHKYLYFVSRGDGTSEFSEDLASHNRAVAKYILGKH
ncbi:MAG TPA: endolytic transglycosylase MltG [Burkholderiaceae bacterium]|nr:endolytic transglycosylase MltG [Burkholderiaceae bacterium]